MEQSSTFENNDDSNLAFQSIFKEGRNEKKKKNYPSVSRSNLRSRHNENTGNITIFCFRLEFFVGFLLSPSLSFAIN